MKLTDAQLRHIERASDPPAERTMAGDRSDYAIADLAGDTTREPDPKVVGVRWATDEVLGAADNVIRASEEVPAREAAKPSPAFESIQSGLNEQRKFALPVLVGRPRRAARRPLVPLTITSLVLLVSTVVGASVLVIVERSRSLKVEALPSTSVTLAAPGVAKSPDASDRPSVQANAPAQAVAPSTPPRPEAPPATSARADTGSGRRAAAAGNFGLSAVAAAPAGTAFARSNGSPRAARGGDAVPGNAGNAVGPQAQIQQAGGGAARVAAVAPRTGGVGGPASQPSSPRQGASAPTTPVSERLTTCLAARPAVLRLSQEEIGKLFKRGEEYMGQGRISAARPLFQRAAEACDMKAAFALGATYDPIMLKKLGVTLLDPNVATARAWYEQARGLGLSEASHQLELLSGLSP
jgi:hypothetical protein